MTSPQLTQLLYCFIVLSVLLLIGTLLRAIFPVFQKIFLPASVIGGFVGLLAGPIIWRGGGIPFPQEWITTWSSLPGVLIVPVVASVPLGMKFGGGGKSAGKSSADMIKMFCVLFLAYITQVILGMITLGLFRGQYALYDTFGYELAQGYSGGHGTAGVVGNFLKGLDLEYWEIAQGVTTTTATFGLVGGMIIGIIYINIMARRGRTTLLKKPGDIPSEMARGIQMDPAAQKSLGQETTYNSSIETLTFHLSVILSGCGIAYLLMNWVKANNVPIINQIPIWAYAIVVMFGVNFVIQKVGLGNLIDNKTKSRITGTCSDFAITAAVASMPVRAVFQYLVPILFMCILGYIITFLVITFCCNHFFDDCHVERSMSVWGSATGVFLNGLMLLKILDPDYDLPVLNDFSVGFSFTSISGFILMPVIVNMLIGSSLMVNLITQIILVLAAFILMMCANQVSKKIAGEELAAGYTEVADNE